jgi:flagellar hook-basal body complex protein FliE
MISKVATGLQAYASAIARGTTSGMEPRQAPGGQFAGALRAAIGDTRETLAQGEAVSTAAVAGKAELTQLVTAVTNAELTLQTVVGVRDRAIQAYQEIMRMPI